MADNSRQVQFLLDRVGESLQKLEEMERSYQEQKETTIRSLEDLVAKIAVLSDSQAIRMKVLRHLYWSTTISVPIIANAFKINETRVRSLAGSMTIDELCRGGCGAQVKLSYASRSSYKNGTPAREAMCQACKSKFETKEKERRAQEERKRQERYKELMTMSWEEFTETSEWKDRRDYLLEMVGFVCETCRKQDCTLYIYPHKDTPQAQLERYTNNIYFVLCSGCIPRVEDLIDRAKRDVIRPELLEYIMDRKYHGRNR